MIAKNPSNTLKKGGCAAIPNSSPITQLSSPNFRETEVLLEAKNISHSFKEGQDLVLKNISLKITKGDFIALEGKSGSGKSTLLQILGALRQPQEGKVFFKERNLKDFSDADRAHFYNQDLAFVFQDFFLLPHLTVLENIQLPLAFSDRKKDFCTPSTACSDDVSESKASKRTKKEPKKIKNQKNNLDLKTLPSRKLKKMRGNSNFAPISQPPSYTTADILYFLDIHDIANHLTSEISGGQKQRVAIARSMMNNPQIIFADEPTGNLDKQNSQKIIDIFRRLNREKGITFLVATHDHMVSRGSNKVIAISDGEINLE